jgi:2-polyprenyl-3-methyl-5-hydroxy-6-metoxy-1,4-benzoquinol methylase
MTDRKRLRDTMSPDELARTYSAPHNHKQWKDHLIRVDLTTQLARWLAGPVRSAADLSCGDGATLKGVDAADRYFGDFAPGYPIYGPIEQTIDEIPKVDLFICTETLEHLHDPDRVLADIRKKTRLLVVSTPIDAWNDTNPEHYWAWSRAGVEGMMERAGFTVKVFVSLDLTPLGRKYYNFGIWGCT